VRNKKLPQIKIYFQKNKIELKKPLNVLFKYSSGAKIYN